MCNKFQIVLDRARSRTNSRVGHRPKGGNLDPAEEDRMLRRIVSLTVLGLVLSTPLASAACNAISRSRLVTCACNGAPAIASYCVYYRGGCLLRRSPW